MQVAATAVTVVLNQLLSIYGAQDPLGAEGALAAIGAANKAIMFAIMPVIGLIMGSQPIIGYNYGARQWQRVLDTVKWASAVSYTHLDVYKRQMQHLIKPKGTSWRKREKTTSF